MFFSRRMIEGKSEGEKGDLVLTDCFSIILLKIPMMFCMLYILFLMILN